MEATPIDMLVPIPVKGSNVMIAGDELVHVPPGVASVSDIVDPMHNADGPEIGAGAGFTVITLVVVHPLPTE